MEQSKELDIFCQNVRWLRKRSKLTQKEMARCMGIGVDTLRRIEQGDFPKRLGAKVLVRLSKQFHISIHDLWSPL